MADLKENVERAIRDFDSIEAAIIDAGIDVPEGTDTSEYGKLITNIKDKTLMSEDFVNISYAFSDGANETLRKKLDTSHAVVMDYTYRRHIADNLVVRMDNCESMQHAFEEAFCKKVSFVIKRVDETYKINSNARIKMYSNNGLEFASNWLNSHTLNEEWDAEFRFILSNKTEADGEYIITFSGLDVKQHTSYCNIRYETSQSYKITHNGVKIMPSQLRANMATHFGCSLSELTNKAIALSGNNYAIFIKNANDTPKLTLANHIFNKCENLTSVTGLNCTNVSTLKYGFYNCKNLKEIKLETLANCEDLSYAFYGCEKLEKIYAFYNFEGMITENWLDTPKLTNIDGAFAKTRLGQLDLNCSNVKSAKGAFANAEFYFLWLNGMTVSFSVENCPMGETALNQLFYSLGKTTNGTVTITGCTGASKCDTSIATRKGWTVINEQ